MDLFDKCCKKQTVIVRCDKADECLDKNIDCAHEFGHIKTGACEIECPENRDAKCIKMEFEED